MFLDAIAGAGTSRLPAKYLRRFQIQQRDIMELEAARIPVAGRLLSWQTQIPHYPPANFRTMVTRGFRYNTVVRRCQGILTSNFCQATLDVQEALTGQSLLKREATGPLADTAREIVGLFRRGGRIKPVPSRTEKRLWTHFLQDVFTYGNALWEKVRGVGTGRVVELWRLHPQQVAVEVSKNRGVTRYLYNVGGKWWPIPLQNVVHWLFPDPDQDFFGLPPLFSALRDLETDNQLVDHLKITLQNLAVPTTVLEHEATLTEEAAREAKRKFRRSFGGLRRGEPAVVGKGTKVNVIGLDMQKMRIGDLVATSEARLAMAHGVPLILLGRSGTQGDPTRANYAEAREHFWTDTMSPLLEEVAEQVTAFLIPEWDTTGQLVAGFNTSKVALLQEAKLRRLERASKAFRDGTVSRHVAQRTAGVETHGPDVLYRRDDVAAVIPAADTTETVQLEEL